MSCFRQRCTSSRLVPTSQKVALFTNFAKQIEVATSGGWSAKVVQLADGATAFVGDAGRTLVITAEGRLFVGVGTQAFAYTESGVVAATNLLKEIPSLLGF